MEVQREQNKSLGARLVNLLVTVVIAYVLALVAIRLFESHLIFFPNYPGRLEGDWHPRNLPVQDVWLSSSDGTRLHAWWMPKDHAKFTFLAFHGNASNIANRAEVYEFLRGTPANVFALEYRGYGHSEGKPSEAGIYRDADAAYQYLVDTEAIAPRSIGLLRAIARNGRGRKPGRAPRSRRGSPGSAVPFCFGPGPQAVLVLSGN